MLPVRQLLDLALSLGLGLGLGQCPSALQREVRHRLQDASGTRFHLKRWRGDGVAQSEAGAHPVVGHSRRAEGQRGRSRQASPPPAVTPAEPSATATVGWIGTERRDVSHGTFEEVPTAFLNGILLELETDDLQ